MDMFVKRKRALLIILSAMLAFSSACGAGGRAAKENAETTDASANTDGGQDKETAVTADAEQKMESTVTADAGQNKGAATAADAGQESDASADAGYDTANPAAGKTAGTEKTAFSPEGVSASAASGIGSHTTVLSGKYKGMTADQITASLTLEQKADQMVQPAVYNISGTLMRSHDYGSLLSTWNGSFINETPEVWYKNICSIQKNALASDAAVPFIYGQDSVHGVNYSLDTVIFPHNINIGMAGDTDLTYQMGHAVAEEILATGMLWNFSPCVASARDPRWGRTYESYSSDPAIVKELASAYTRGMVEGGAIACPKHFFGDGNTLMGTGEYMDGRALLDRGDAQLSDAEIEALLAVYRSQIDSGAQSLMVSHSALNGVKMHENRHYLIDVLRGQMGFEGVVLSDWESIHNITSTSDFNEQVITAVNAGIDMLMEPNQYDASAGIICDGVRNGKISEERVNEAVTRIIQMKMDAGLFEDPYMEERLAGINADPAKQPGSDAHKELAAELVRDSMVLLKNDNSVLPLKPGTKVYVTGPAANDVGVQCGGWTRCWQGMTDAEYGSRLIKDGTTLSDGLQDAASGGEISVITDPGQASEADVVILCLGEIPYSEWYGDTEDLSVTGPCGLSGNLSAIREAASLGKPVVTLLVTGRNTIIEEYAEGWDAVVMCGLPGSEGAAAADVLTGKHDFTGRLAMPWYKDEADIESGQALYPVGYGLQYSQP